MVLKVKTDLVLNLKNNKIYSPKKDFYEGITYKFFRSKVKKISKKEIFINELKKFEEILLIGSGKGVTSVKTIKQISWKRKKLGYYKKFTKYYLSAVNNCKLYKFK